MQTERSIIEELKCMLRETRVRSSDFAELALRDDTIDAAEDNFAEGMIFKIDNILEFLEDRGF